MTNNSGQKDHTTLSPDEAYSMLGNETRIQILRTLGEIETPLSFSELRERVGIRQGAQFNYHLNKLVGHFIEKKEEGYILRQPGRRVIQAILSGAVTEDPKIEPTQVNFPCDHCGSNVIVSYSRGKMQLSCEHCGGNFSRLDTPSAENGDENMAKGNLASMPLPPTGVENRSPLEIFRAAATLEHLNAIAATSNVCPYCAGHVTYEISDVCEDHDASVGLCDNCQHKNAVRIRFVCKNCIFEETYPMVMALLTVPELTVFVSEHGLNMTSKGVEWGWIYGEEIIATEPFKAKFTFTIDDDSISITIDENLDVIETTRH
ncbi:MAG: winged helix-turn-helix domain-containing protein [Halobacteriaceae archaeon]